MFKCISSGGSHSAPTPPTLNTSTSFPAQPRSDLYKRYSRSLLMIGVKNRSKSSFNILSECKAHLITFCGLGRKVQLSINGEYKFGDIITSLVDTHAFGFLILM